MPFTVFEICHLPKTAKKSVVSHVDLVRDYFFGIFPLRFSLYNEIFACSYFIAFRSHYTVRVRVSGASVGTTRIPGFHQNSSMLKKPIDAETGILVIRWLPSPASPLTRPIDRLSPRNLTLVPDSPRHDARTRHLHPTLAPDARTRHSYPALADNPRDER